MLLCTDKKARSVPQKIQYSPVFHADRQKGVSRRESEGQRRVKLRQDEDGEKRRDTDDAHIPQRPQPKIRRRLEVLGVYILSVRKYQLLCFR
jgi:hypothetical protein